MLKTEDLKHISTLLHPLYFYSKLSDLNVVNIPQTYYDSYQSHISIMRHREVFQLILKDIKQHLRYVRQRDNVKTADLESALALRVFGVPIGDGPLIPVSTGTTWAKFITRSTSNNTSIPGKVTISGLNNYKQKQIDMATMKAVSLFFSENASANYALLKDNIWARNDSNIMTFIKYTKDPQTLPISYCFDPSYMPIHKIEDRLFKATRQFVKAYRKYPEVYSMHFDLMEAWLDYGGLNYSPAAASVSCVGQFGIEEGWPALTIKLNGIAVAVTVCKLINGSVNICVNIDHAVWSGEMAGMFYTFLKNRIPQILEDIVYENSINRRK